MSQQLRKVKSTGKPWMYGKIINFSKISEINPLKYSFWRKMMTRLWGALSHSPSLAALKEADSCWEWHGMAIAFHIAKQWTHTTKVQTPGRSTIWQSEAGDCYDFCWPESITSSGIFPTWSMKKKQHSINYLRVQYDKKFFGYVFFSWNMLKLLLWTSMHYLWITSTQISYCHSHRWKIHPEVAGQESPVGLSNLTPHMVRHSTRCAICEGQVICGKNAHYMHDIYIYILYIYASVYVLYVVYVM